MDRLRLRHQLPVLSPLPIASILAAGWDATVGSSDPVAHLTALVRDEFAAGLAVPCGSGTQALDLAIRYAAARTGSPAIALPAFCCYDVATAATGASAPIALYDIDPTSLSPDLDSLERLLRSGVRVVVVAHLYGLPVDWDSVSELARRHDAVVIEDAAQGQGGSWRGRPLGSLGSLSVLSLGRGKGWTGGGGGVLLLRNGFEDAYIDERTAAPSGWPTMIKSVVQALLARPGVYGLPAALPWLALGETRYHPPVPATALASAAAALALRTREASLEEARHRRSAGADLEARIRGLPAVSAILKMDAAEPGFLRFPVRVIGGLGAFPSPTAALRTGIGRCYPTALDALAVVQKRRFGPIADYPGARALAAELITLPTHSWVAREDLDAIEGLLRALPLPVRIPAVA